MQTYIMYLGAQNNKNIYACVGKINSVISIQHFSTFIYLRTMYCLYRIEEIYLHCKKHYTHELGKIVLGKIFLRKQTAKQTLTGKLCGMPDFSCTLHI